MPRCHGREAAAVEDDGGHAAVARPARRGQHRLQGRCGCAATGCGALVGAWRGLCARGSGRCFAGWGPARSTHRALRATITVAQDSGRRFTATRGPWRVAARGGCRGGLLQLLRRGFLLRALVLAPNEPRGGRRRGDGRHHHHSFGAVVHVGLLWPRAGPQHGLARLGEVAMAIEAKGRHLKIGAAGTPRGVYPVLNPEVTPASGGGRPRLRSTLARQDATMR